MADPIRVTGLREFQAGLRKMDAGLARQLRLVLNEASDVVIEGALPHIPRRTGRAAASLKAKSTQRVVRVAAGSANAPYYPWLDFGGRVGINKSVRRPFLKRGRYIYPAYDRSKDDVEKALRLGLIGLAERSGIAVD